MGGGGGGQCDNTLVQKLDTTSVAVLSRCYHTALPPPPPPPPPLSKSLFTAKNLTGRLFSIAHFKQCVYVFDLQMLASSRLTIGTAPSLCRRCHILLTHKSYRNLSPILGPPTSIQTAKLSSCLSQVNSRTSTEKLTQVSHIHRFWSSLHTHRRHLQPGHHSRTAQIYTKSESLPEDLSFENILCDTNRRRVVDFMGSVDPVRTLKMFGVKEGAKVQAVLVPLCLVDGEPSILFTLRSSSLKKHRGEVR